MINTGADLATNVAFATIPQALEGRGCDKKRPPNEAAFREKSPNFKTVW
jgi:hypothetical protein